MEMNREVKLENNVFKMTEILPYLFADGNYIV